MSKENLTQLSTINKQNSINFIEKDAIQSNGTNFGAVAQNLVMQNEWGAIITTTLRIAELFEKRHFHIIRDIEKLKQQLPKEFNESNLGRVDYTDAKGEKRPTYTLTRDAFSLLVMGFTGEKALQWKLKYIEAFNSMERELQAKRLCEFQQITDKAFLQGFDSGRESGLKDMEAAKEISYQQGMEYGQSLPAVQIETQKSYLQGLTEGRKIQKAEDNKKQDNWQKMEKAIDYLGKGVSLKDTARLVKLCPGTIRNRFRRLGLWEQVKNGDLWFNMPAKKQKKPASQPEQLSLI